MMHYDHRHNAALNTSQMIQLSEHSAGYPSDASKSKYMSVASQVIESIYNTLY